MIKTNTDILNWIHENLGSAIRELTDNKYSDSLYTEALLAGITCRETGFLILRYANQGKDFETICSLMKGDYSRRPGESSKRYHGFGFIQIDINSYPKFIEDTPLSDYISYFEKSILVLEEKRLFLERNGYNAAKLGNDIFLQAIVASYNCGQGNVLRALNNGYDVDKYTFGGDYSKSVFEFRYTYWKLFNNQN